MKATKSITAQVNELRCLKKKREEIDSQIKAIEDKIKIQMENRKDYEILGEDFKITWSLVVSKQFSQSEFKKLCPDLYAKFTSLKESRRFLLK